jgi:hypothetical protein
MGNAKVEDPPKRSNDGLLYYLMDRHMWIFTLFLVPISLVYDVYFKIYLLVNLWRDRQKVGNSNRHREQTETERQEQKDRNRKTETERQVQKDRDRKTETKRQKQKDRNKKTEAE